MSGPETVQKTGRKKNKAYKMRLEMTWAISITITQNQKRYHCLAHFSSSRQVVVLWSADLVRNPAGSRWNLISGTDWVGKWTCKHDKTQQPTWQINQTHCVTLMPPLSAEPQEVNKLTERAGRRIGLSSALKQARTPWMPMSSEKQTMLSLFNAYSRWTLQSKPEDNGLVWALLCILTWRIL